MLESCVLVQGVGIVVGLLWFVSVLCEGLLVWWLLLLLLLNYLFFVDEDLQCGVLVLCELVGLFVQSNDVGLLCQVEGLCVVGVNFVVCCYLVFGFIVFGCGLEVCVEVDEFCFEGGSVILLGIVLYYYFSCYVLMNSFVQIQFVFCICGEFKCWVFLLGVWVIL